MSGSGAAMEGGQSGLVVERATDEDADAIIALNASENGETVGVEVRCAFRLRALTPGDFAVVRDGRRIVSTVALMSAQFIMDDVVIPVGQPEFVATHPDYRGRGLVRALLERVHRWSADRGDLVQIIAGIAYFYRQFGYQYGLPEPRQWLIPPETDLGDSGDWVTRRAASDDIPQMSELQRIVQSAAELRLPYADAIWPVLAELPHTELVVVERDGVVGGVGQIHLSSGQPVYLHGPAVSCLGAARALVQGVRQRHPGSSLVVAERPSAALTAVLVQGALPVQDRRWLYVRMPDPVALLTHLRPVLSARLTESPFAHESGEAVISLYRSSVSLTYDCGTLTTVTSGPGMQSPVAQGASGIPPDIMPEVLFGPQGIVALEHHADLNLGRQRALMAVLFPPVRSDVLTW